MTAPHAPKDESGLLLDTQFGISIKKILFVDGSQIELGPTDIIVLVGPNNCGKSVSLIEVTKAIKDGENINAKLVRNVEVEQVGSPASATLWFKKRASHLQERLPIRNIDFLARIFVETPNAKNKFYDLVHGFIKHLTTANRLSLVQPVSQVPKPEELPTNPIQAIARDDKLELEISKAFRAAFGMDLVVHRIAGAQIPIYCGERPQPNSSEGEDRMSFSYLRRIEQLPKLQEQGDGMRAYAGLILYTRTEAYPVTLVDEPEAFLHPPQARLLGRSLVELSASQFFFATHSGDFLRGLLESSSERVHVLRLNRTTSVTQVSELAPFAVQALWKDPILRFSNILDGLFHERVVVCEGDADCRFYSAVLNTLRTETGKIPDILFVHCGGKERLHTVATALHALKVPVTIIPDFDFLNKSDTVERLVKAVGGVWEKIHSTLKQLQNEVDMQKPNLDARDVKRDIEAALKGVDESKSTVFPKEAAEMIADSLKRGSPWAHLKVSGLAGLPSGNATANGQKVLLELSLLGIHVVPCGTLERWVKSVGNHGPKWVIEVLEKKNLRVDEELAPAREFIRKALL